MARRWRRLSRTHEGGAHRAAGPRRRRRRWRRRGMRSCAQQAPRARPPARRCAPARRLVAPVAAQLARVHMRARWRAPTARPPGRALARRSPAAALAPAVVQVVAVVDDVDAADEGHLAVDHAQLLVQAAQLAGLQPAPPAVERPEHRQLHAAAVDQRSRSVGRLAARAEAVDHDAHLHAAPRRGDQRVGHRLAGPSSWKM